MDIVISKLQKYFAALPIGYLLIAVFLARGHVQYVYASVLALVTLVVLSQRRTKLKPDIFLAQWLVTLAAIGLSSAVILSIEKIELLSQPSRIASCSLSPIVACSPIIASPQASAFGFANSFIGIFGFTAVFTAGMTILAGSVRMSRLWWRALLGGITFGTGFCVWLFYQGVFDIGKLCLYCMLVWLVTTAMFWLTAAFCIQNNYINLGSRLNKLVGFKYELIAATYALIFMILFYRWSDYWLSLL